MYSLSLLFNSDEKYLSYHYNVFPALGISDSLFVLNRLIVVGLKNLVDPDDRKKHSLFCF